jgi:2-isopropylmalate synthase
MKSILINDITLRDGEQAAGVNFLPDEKLRIAEQLVRLGVPIIEAGFPIASDEDVKGVNLIAKEFGDHIVISAMCRAKSKDIEIAAEALGDAEKGRIQVVMGTSDIHLKHKFNMTRQQALELSVEMVEYAKTFTEDVEFAAEDATRSNRMYLIDVCCNCVEAGAQTIELPDTVGYATAEDYFELVAAIVNALPDNITVSTHCHDDLGLAVANTLAGIKAGAKQAEVTVNGIGERVGNAATEEVIMALKMREDIYNGDISYINTKEIIRTSRLVEELSKIKVAYNKAIVGRNAFLHESGIHQDGMIKSPQTYQLMNPKDIGLDGYKLMIGKLSGKHALEQRMKNINIYEDEEAMKDFAKYFKNHAAKKKFITDDDIVHLLGKFKDSRKCTYEKFSEKCVL